MTRKKDSGVIAAKTPESPHQNEPQEAVNAFGLHWQLQLK